MQKKNFNLESSFYPEKVILQGINDFGEEFSIDYHTGILSVEGENLEEIQKIFDEFMNYILALQNEQY